MNKSIILLVILLFIFNFLLINCSKNDNDNPLAPGGSTTLFSDAFNRISLGANWDNTYFSGLDQTIFITNEMVCSTIPDPPSASCYITEINNLQLILKFEFKLLELNTRAGIFFKATNSMNYYTFWYDDDLGHLALGTITNDFFSVLSSTNLSLQTNKWYNLKLTINNNIFQGEVKDNTILIASVLTTNNLLNGNRFGIMLAGTTNKPSYGDNFIIESY